ncbi:hypothetical protein PAT3040_06327 [Paenibacillus agaridevorans]|uniref:SLH domain-containing protein n=1 Tax=Paenibacillus agaridevorans TaxID=171404 RepID=A0A2R5EZG3_9BACL|nr:S-layer homology domain-containing protein [Paenibacillus agaridevorans]GBG11505.1 hypothetical protein PAT3040_06327 [Paenibacillus agaridevorans]
MKIKRTWQMIIGMLILSLMAQALPLASAAPASPELEVKSAQAYAGQSAIVDIVINRPKGLKTFEFQLNYDRSALELSDANVTKGQDVSGWLYQYKAEPGKGTVRVAAVHMDGFASDNQAHIMRLTFKAIGSMGVKTFNVTQLKAFESVDGESNITSKIGSFTIMGGSPPIRTGTPVEPGKADWSAEVSINNGASQLVSIDNSQAASVTIKVETSRNVGSIRVGLQNDLVDRILDSGKSLVIQSPIGELVLDARTVSPFAGQNIVITLEQAEGSARQTFMTLKVEADGQAIANFDGKVKVILPYSNEISESDENLVVYRKDGNRTAIIPQAVAVNGKVTFVTRNASTFEIGYNSKPFNDVAEHWSERNIAFVATKELFLGISAEMFGPDRTMSRGMLATVLGRMIGVEATALASASNFTDVEAGSYYAPYIAYASENGIVNGVGGGRFAPDREVTREEMANMIMGFMKHIQLAPPESIAKRKFEDEGAIAGWAVADIQHLQAAGILDGKPGNRFDPKGLVTRAEAAKVIRVLLEISVR